MPGALFALFIVVMALARLVPHPLNVTPIGAMAIFSGAYVNHRYQWLLPVAALLIGDLVTGLYSGVVMLGVYGGFAIGALIAKRLLSPKWSPGRLAMVVVINAVVFYLTSNLAMWYVAYPGTSAGLLQCYINGIPFLAKSLMGDFLYSALIFGAAHVAQGISGQQASRAG